MIFACSLVHTDHHELLTGQYMERYVKCIKRFTGLTESLLNIYAENTMMFPAEENYIL